MPSWRSAIPGHPQDPLRLGIFQEDAIAEIVGKLEREQRNWYLKRVIDRNVCLEVVPAALRAFKARGHR
jgi:hypothetical protein